MENNNHDIARAEFSFFKRPIKNTKPSKRTTVAEIHQLVTGSKYKAHTERYRGSGDFFKKTFKKGFFDYVCFSGTFKERKTDALIEHSGFLVLDFDDLEDQESLKEKLMKFPFSVLAFTSVGGCGVKWVVRIAKDARQHKAYFNALAQFVRDNFDLEVDQSGKDVSRACFLCWDPNAIIHSGDVELFPLKENKVERDLESNASIPKTSITEENVENGVATNAFDHVFPKVKAKSLKEAVVLAETLVDQKIDITTDYNTWVRIGLALTELGEKGRKFFHQVSSMYPDYTKAECDEKYSELLKNRKGDVSLATFFHIGRSALNQQNQKKGEKLPELEAVFEHLPPLLKDFCAFFDGVERDMVLVGSLGVLSSCFPNYYCIYDKRKVESNFYALIVAGASAGKGVVKLAKSFARGIEQERASMRRSPKEWFLHFIPANTSSAGLYKALNDNKGRGLFFSTEADTLSENFGKEWGDFSSVLRQSYHHETISFLRKTDNEFFEIKSPHISVVLTGTPGQIKQLVNSVEDGLFSRFSFLRVHINPVVKNVFDNDNYEDREEQEALNAAQVLNAYKILKERNPDEPIKFELTTEQVQRFQRQLEEWNQFVVMNYDEEAISTMFRNGLVTIRLAMILTMLRNVDRLDSSIETLTCQDIDLETAMIIGNRFLKNNIEIYEDLVYGRVRKKLPKNKQKLLEALPRQFSRQQALKVLNDLNLPGLSQRSLDRFLQDQDYFEKMSIGRYRKI